MYFFCFSSMLDVHVTDKKALEKLKESNYRAAFDNVLVGVNLASLSCINDIAVYITSLTFEQLQGVTFKDVVEAVGEYEDLSGNLV